MGRNLSLRKQGREQELLPKDTEGDEIFLMLPELFYLFMVPQHQNIQGERGKKWCGQWL